LIFIFLILTYLTLYRFAIPLVFMSFHLIDPSNV